MKKHISDFYDHLSTNYPDVGRNRYSNRDAIQIASDKLFEHMKSLSTTEFRALISDRHWNSYPIYTCGYTQFPAINLKNYYCIISRAVTKLIYTSAKHKKDLIALSAGAFRIATINSALGKDKLKAARIALKSRDSRARKLAVNILPVKDLFQILNTEKDKSILNRLSIRIGYINMLDVEKSSGYRYNRSRAFLNDEFNAEEIRELVQKKEAGDKIPFYEQDIFRKLTYHISEDEVPFYLDLFNKLSQSDKETKKIFLAKLTGRGNA